MAKSKPKGKGRLVRKQPQTVWTADQHSARLDTRLASLHKKGKKHPKVDGDKAASEEKDNCSDCHADEVYKRSSLARDSSSRIDATKLKLKMSLLLRETNKLRLRLSAWDAEDEMQRGEKKQHKEDIGRECAIEGDETATICQRRKMRRPCDVSKFWKLKGAARPASVVYDFDTRYADPHLQLHLEAQNRTKRSKNIFFLYRGRFASNDAPQPYCRQFLSLLVRLGALYLEGKKYKMAKEALEECMQLEGNNYDAGILVTNARCLLARMFLKISWSDAAKLLFEKVPLDKSSWLRYGAALVEYINWGNSKTDGSFRDFAETLLVEAFMSNIYCAYYLAFKSTFDEVMEYVDEIEDADAGTLEEAIEYCASEQMEVWRGTAGAIDWLKSNLLRVRKTLIVGAATKDSFFLNWDNCLKRAEVENRASRSEVIHAHATSCDQSEVKDITRVSSGDDISIDFLMYSGMFRTAINMLEEGGALS